MKERCQNKNAPNYKHYGGRGINVCEEWSGFQGFYNWAIINGYDECLSIDRINVNMGYEPSNCRWATQKEQINNCRANRFITIDGNTKTVAQWADFIGIHQDRIYLRLFRGWDPSDAIFTPTSRQNAKHKRG